MKNVVLLEQETLYECKVLRIRFLIFMWLTVKKDNLIRSYDWDIPYMWSP